MNIVGKIAHRIRDPIGTAYNNYEKLQNGYILRTNSLLKPWKVKPTSSLVNVANFNTYNGGDALLTVVLRDLLDSQDKPFDWKKIHAHSEVTNNTIKKINETNGLIIGGGGLFLIDSKSKNTHKSGWQWGVSAKDIKKIEVPISVFAVGYNRFRGQPEFPPYFVDSLNELVHKSSFFGLRNNGSIAAIKKYLSPELREKVVYQPCMTTVLKDIYPTLTRAEPREGIIAVNMAFDRPELRFGDDYEEKFRKLCISLRELSKSYSIEYVSHAIPDEEFVRYLKKYNVPFIKVKLYRCSGLRVLDYYKDVALTIGMRGHAQMIPFGLGNPILSLITHNKMRWFLEDNGIPEYGVEFSENDFAEKILDLSSHIMKNIQGVRSELNSRRQLLKDITFKNAALVANNFSR